MRRWIPLLLLVLGLCFQAPALAETTPALAEALSSARVGVGNVITDGAGQPVLDGNGYPLTVTAIETSASSQTLTSLANALRVPIADLLAYTQRLGMTLPILMTGTQTTVVRSDGGVEQIFVFKAANGHEYAFMADKTGNNVFGIRIANVDPTGMAQLMTAHGLNGNFTNPPWYLTDAAKKDYWIAWGQEQIFTPAPPTMANGPRGVSGVATAHAKAKIRTGDHRVLSKGQQAILTDTFKLLGGH